MNDDSRTEPDDVEPATRTDAVAENDEDDDDAGTERPSDRVSDGRQKHVSVVRRSGERVDRGNVFVGHATDAFVVSSDRSFPVADTTRYSKSDLLRVEINQHHSACFITTATTGEGSTLDALRGFRDGVLVRSRPGRALVASYDLVSPPIARTLARYPTARPTRAVRRLIEMSATLARRRSACESALGRLLLSTMLVCLYVVGIALGLASHFLLRARERTE